MKRSLCLTGALLAVALPFLGTCPYAAAAEPQGALASSASAAEHLVRSALEEELAGGERRSELLQRALREDPDCGPARWHAGFVRQGDRWLTLADVRRAAAADEHLAGYRTLRDGYVDNAVDHARLARWCRRNRLEEEARAHWIRVLQLQPDHQEAINALGLRPYDGMLLSQEQIEQLKRQKQQVIKALERWRPKLVQWKLASRRSDGSARQAVLEEIRSVSTPQDIAGVELSIRQQCAARTPDRDLYREPCLALISALGKLPEEAATESLIRLAVDAPWEDVRQAAADQLKTRPQHDYLPILLAGMAYPIEFSAGISLGPDFSVYRQIRLYREGQDADVSLLRYEVDDHSQRPRLHERDGPIQAIPSPGRLASAATDLRWALKQAGRVRARVERANAMTERLNERIQTVLTRTTGLDYGDDLQKWGDAWKDYNELEYGDEKPVYEIIRYGLPSCFARGTSVWTPAGEVPIERIKLGDRVLSQDTDTGELAFKPVLQVTTRQPSRMIKVDLGSETITATRGHPFWVNGQGWQMAKKLSVGANLHSASGAVPIAGLTETDPAKPWYEVSCNLVVADFGTYFVGKHKVLVHDNTMRRPSLAVVPGLAAAGRKYAVTTPPPE